MWVYSAVSYCIRIENNPHSKAVLHASVYLSYRGSEGKSERAVEEL